MKLETLFGYKYFGYFPQNILLRIRFSFNSGIVDWWQKYIKWFLVLKTNRDYATNSLIEYFRLTNGTMAKFKKIKFYDLNLLKNTLCYLWSLVETVPGSKFWSKLNPFYCFGIRINQQKTQVKRFSLQDILLKEMNEK